MQMCPSLHCHSCCYSYIAIVLVVVLLIAFLLLLHPSYLQTGFGCSRDALGGRARWFRGSQLALWRPSSGDSCFGAPELDPPKGTSCPAREVRHLEKSKLCSRHSAVRVLGCAGAAPAPVAHKSDFGVGLMLPPLCGACSGLPPVHATVWCTFWTHLRNLRGAWNGSWGCRTWTVRGCFTVWRPRRQNSVCCCRTVL